LEEVRKENKASRSPKHNLRWRSIKWYIWH